MSRALVCDNCGTTLPLLGRNEESETGEEAAWLQVVTTWTTADLCSRACAADFVLSAGFAERHDAEAQAVMEVARTIRDGADDDEAT